MIFKTLLLAIFTILFYFLIDYKYFGESILKPVNQWEQNKMKAEKYLYSDMKEKEVIVGSSLSDRLNMNFLPGIYNLSLSGQSVFDGINIIKFNKKIICKIYIEINNLTKKEDDNFKESIIDNPNYILKEKLAIFRVGHKPISIISNSINNKIFKTSEPKKVIIKQSTNNISENTNKELIKQLSINLNKIDLHSINLAICKLKKNVDYFKKNNIEIVFFEMPINFKLENCLMLKIIRKKIKKYFPEIIFLENSFRKKYITSDGLHLGPEESYIYTLYFRSNLIVK